MGDNISIEQKQAYEQSNLKRTFAEFNAVKNGYMQKINAELFLMFQDLAKSLDERRAGELDGIIKDFQQEALNPLSEKIKTCYY